MFCPKCSAYLMERQLIKTDVKYAPGNIAIEYAAQCPVCHVDMGRVSWGQLTVNPDLERALAAEKETTAAKEAVEAAPEEAAKRCPHCGEPLPADY